MNFSDIVRIIREDYKGDERRKGARFESLMCLWLKTDPRYCYEIESIWLWEDFPFRKSLGGIDSGIDIVARTYDKEYWAIQCKFYADGTTLKKGSIDSFLSTAGREFFDDEQNKKVGFSRCFLIQTTEKLGSNANEVIINHNPPVSTIKFADINDSGVDWQKIWDGASGIVARLKKKEPLLHQVNAVNAAYDYYVRDGNDRGKLIMACGTGKTYTSLLIAKKILSDKGLVLFMVPSIALLSQVLNEWSYEEDDHMKAICICSDSKVQRKSGKYEDYNFDGPEDLAVPASTDPLSAVRQLRKYREHDGLVVVFSTYQSIDTISEAQRIILEETGGEYGIFDFVICDEAHRTTGARISDEDESNFIKIHSNENISGRKRLYMTATPRLYGESAKIKASLTNCVLCSMDDESLYGKEFFRVNFSYAVQNGLLTDYKVLVLTVSPEDIPKNIRADVTSDTTELNFDDTSKLIGVISGLSKIIKGDDGKTWNSDPKMMRRAVAFCQAIGNEKKPGTSKFMASVFPRISEEFDKNLDEETLKKTVKIEARHIDGSMNSSERNQIMSWLSDTPSDDRECRIVTNVRCLSEGVDVPSLDAVIFLSARNSQVDVVQSVGRVMRTFHKGLSDEKKYGYIIIPIVVPSNVSAEEALNNSKAFEVVWSILNALRSHDDRFNAMVNKIQLNKNPQGIVDGPTVTIGYPGIGAEDDGDSINLDGVDIDGQLTLRFGELRDGIYAKLVEKCGDRLYWENWAKSIGKIALDFIDRIEGLIDSGEHKEAFDKYLIGLQRDINPSVDRHQAIEMLAQHMITRPVFDALFSEYQFVNNNAVSQSMQHMIDLLQQEAFDKDTKVLEEFYQSVKTNVSGIDNLEGKQTLIKNLYEKFFKGAFPLTVEKLGIVYTPIECVDFIIHSVDDILRKEFNTSLTEENVHVLDPFVGTGTFITRTLQSGLIRSEDLERKYKYELHCNEIVLLAYYIADVNIEAVFHDLTHRESYLPYDNICLTDTFQLAESDQGDWFTEFFKDNSERVERQKGIPVKVIMGNPPYSVGQKSANDNAQNLSYPNLEKRIEETYVAKSGAQNKNSLYDTYIKAFRWASDRINTKWGGGIIAFITNGAWIDGNAHDGFRRSLEEEFSSIYVLNLRGNANTSGELRKKECGGIFGSGSRTPIAITFLVKNPLKKREKAVIYYHDIGDYLTREQKLKMVKDFGSISSESLDWKIIKPNDKADWINQRDGVFDTLIPLVPSKKFDLTAQSVFVICSCGIKTQRDSWSYNSSSDVVTETAKESIDLYNSTLEARKLGEQVEPDYSSTKISWSDSVLNNLKRGVVFKLEDIQIREVSYRPFFRQSVLWYKPLIERLYRMTDLFPKIDSVNTVICVSGIGSKDFSCLITNVVPDLGIIGSSQCFPMYWYEKYNDKGSTLFDENEEEKYIRHDGISDWILKEVRSRFGNTRYITKEHIFYYVYGILHSKDYRGRFKDDLRKSLPRIPIVERVEDFMDFYKAGRALGELHLNYEENINRKSTKDGFVSEAARILYESYGVTVEGDIDIFGCEWTEDIYNYFRVEKLRFNKVRDEQNKLVPDKTKIIYNGKMAISNIPLKVYEYVVNGKSAVEWIMERYAITIDKQSLIKNDPNDWAYEHNQPRYILDLLLLVIDLSIKTVDIVNQLPRLNAFDIPMTLSEDD